MASAANSLVGTRALVTGGAGFVGSTLVIALAEGDASARAVDAMLSGCPSLLRAPPRRSSPPSGRSRRAPYYRGFCWANSEPGHLAHLFRHVALHRDEAAQKGRRAAAEMAAKWTWGRAARHIAARLDEIG